jgi:hypothetical protein
MQKNMKPVTLTLTTAVRGSLSLDFPIVLTDIILSFSQCPVCHIVAQLSDYDPLKWMRRDMKSIMCQSCRDSLSIDAGRPVLVKRNASISSWDYCMHLDEYADGENCSILFRMDPVAQRRRLCSEIKDGEWIVNNNKRYIRILKSACRLFLQFADWMESVCDSDNTRCLQQTRIICKAEKIRVCFDSELSIHHPPALLRK